MRTADLHTRALAAGSLCLAYAASFWARLPAAVASAAEEPPAAAAAGLPGSAPQDGKGGAASVDTLLERMRAQADPELRSQLLLDLAELCLSQPCPLPPASLLREAETAVAAIPQPAQQLALWLRLALLQQRHGFRDLAQNSLQHARRSVEAAPPARREALLLRLGLAYAELGEEEQAGRAMADSDALHRAAAERNTSFPFPDGKLKGRVGLAAGLIQSVSQSLWPEPPAWGLLGGIAPSLCPKPPLPQLILI